MSSPCRRILVLSGVGGAGAGLGYSVFAGFDLPLRVPRQPAPSLQGFRPQLGLLHIILVYSRRVVVDHLAQVGLRGPRPAKGGTVFGSTLLRTILGTGRKLADGVSAYTSVSSWPLVGGRPEAVFFPGKLS
jgi:hypothetical protein